MKKFRPEKKVTLRDDGTLRQYFNDVSNIKQFTPTEEEECAMRAATGDQAALDELVLRNLRFVISVAKQYETPTTKFHDLINEGNIGLIMAAKEFDITKGFKFITYAIFWVRKLIMEYLTKHDRLIRLPSNKVVEINKLRQKINLLELSLGREADISEIIEYLDIQNEDDKMDIIDIHKMINISFESFDMPLNDDESTRYDFTFDNNQESTDYHLIKNDLNNQINNILDHFKPLNRKIIVLLFGLDGSNPLTLKEVGKIVNLTPEMVRQIKNRTLQRIKVELKL